LYEAVYGISGSLGASSPWDFFFILGILQERRRQENTSGRQNPDDELTVIAGASGTVSASDYPVPNTINGLDGTRTTSHIQFQIQKLKSGRQVFDVS
jgi:hypothetical protein